jgi:hypothetical protein
LFGITRGAQPFARIAMQKAEHEVAGFVANVAGHSNRDLADLLEELFPVLEGGGVVKERKRKESRVSTGGRTLQGEQGEKQGGFSKLI